MFLACLILKLSSISQNYLKNKKNSITKLLIYSVIEPMKAFLQERATPTLVELPDGDVVLIKQSTNIEDGQIYAVEFNNQTYVKKVYLHKTYLRLVSINKKYDDIYAPYEENPRIIGKIVGNFTPVKNPNN